MRASLGAAVVLGTASILSVSCLAGSAGKAVRPDAPTAKDAIGASDAPKCRTVAAYAEPLVVDWKSADRVDLELGMRAGVVVVAYDCRQFRILKSCVVDGSYAFAGVSRKEDAVQLVDSDEVHANLPLGATKLSGEVARGSSLDLALVLIGKQTTTLERAARSELAGSCEGATHFVRAATIGAFAMSTGVVGRARGVSELFNVAAGGASSSEKKTSTRDGDLEACRQTKVESAEPPTQCRTALRLDLVPITDAPPREEPAAVRGFANPCSDGMVWSEGRCASKPGAAAHLCAEDDLVDCAKQCERGSAASCHNAARIYTLGKRVTDDPGRAADFLERSCTLGYAPACGMLGDRLFSGFGRPKDPKTGEQLEARACAMGDGSWCRVLGRLYASGRDGISKNVDRATEAFLRGCNLGDGGACGELGDALLQGSWTSKDLPKGVALYKRACDAGGPHKPQYCFALGEQLHEGRGVPRDTPRALAAFQRACSSASTLDDAGKACVKASRIYQKGDGVAKDPARAREMLEKGCAASGPNGSPNPNDEACMSIGTTYERGDGVAVDLARAASAYELACRKNVKTCRKYGEMLEQGRGVPKDVQRAGDQFVTACAAKDDAACVAQKRLGR